MTVSTQSIPNLKLPYDALAPFVGMQPDILKLCINDSYQKNVGYIDIQSVIDANPPRYGFPPNTFPALKLAAACLITEGWNTINFSALAKTAMGDHPLRGISGDAGIPIQSINVPSLQRDAYQAMGADSTVADASIRLTVAALRDVHVQRMVSYWELTSAVTRSQPEIPAAFIPITSDVVGSFWVTLTVKATPKNVHDIAIHPAATNTNAQLMLHGLPVDTRCLLVPLSNFGVIAALDTAVIAHNQATADGTLVIDLEQEKYRHPQNYSYRCSYSTINQRDDYHGSKTNGGMGIIAIAPDAPESPWKVVWRAQIIMPDWQGSY